MKKKQFLLILTACLIFCLNLTSCDNEGTPVTGLWEKIRNTAWTMDKTIENWDGEKFDVTYTIGFYPPGYGPNPRYSPNGKQDQVEGPSSGSPGGYTPPNYTSDANGRPIIPGSVPYVVIRCDFKNKDKAFADWMDAGEYSFEYFDGLEINRGGNTISAVNPWFYESNGREKSFTPSFHVSVSDNGELSISKVRMAPSDWDNRIFNGMNGKYTFLFTDPDFTFAEGKERVLPFLRNTAWTKQGDSKPSIGFYEGGTGPGSYGSNYVILKTPDGTADSYLYISDSGVRFHVDNFYFNFDVSNNGNTLTISKIRKGWDGASPIMISGTPYDEVELGRQFIGTYTKTENYNSWGEDGAILWSKIKNTAWKKQGSSRPSVGFYEIGKGPESDYTNYSNAEQYFGYVSFITPDGIASRLIRKSDNISEFSITADGLTFRINVSGDTLTISNINPPNEYEWVNEEWSEKLHFYSDSGFSYRYYNNQPTAEYNKEALGGYFNGTYTKASSDPNYDFDEGRELLWSQIKNTAWTKSGESKPSVGFYEHGETGGRVVFKKQSNTYFEAMYLLIYKDIDYNNNPNVNRNGDTITWNEIVFNIAVSNNGDTLTISNVRLGEGYGSSNLSDYLGLNGTYSKTSFDPDYLWD